MRASTTDDNAAFADSDKSNVKIYFLTVPYLPSEEELKRELNLDSFYKLEE